MNKNYIPNRRQTTLFQNRYKNTNLYTVAILKKKKNKYNEIIYHAGFTHEVRVHKLRDNV